MLIDYVLNIIENELGFFILTILVSIMLVWIIVLTISFSRLKAKYKKLMKGDNKNLEQLIKDYMSYVDTATERVDVLSRDLIHLKEQTDRCIQKVNIIRYNAFADTGSDLSYSIAMLDNYDNGVIITSIYGRNESVTYAKPIENGKSRYPLSVEEEMVLDRCLKIKR
ncbi:MAG TPA: DUF4446 family protein [Clostridiales bacterium]|nr:DUF4446 family protein [Clostridiales bacterium]